MLALVSVVVSACAYQVDLQPSQRSIRTSFVYAADGSVITSLHAEEDRVPVNLDAIDSELVDAVLAIEDARFYQHRGVDVAATGRALLRNLSAGDITQGGSTITQQYVKNRLLGSEQTLARKIEEASLAFQLEQRLSKDEILQRYLNTVYFGLGAYGVQAAARQFFRTDASDLSLAQAALLAGMIRAPERYAPLRQPDAADHRRTVVLRRMLDLGMIDQADLERASQAPLGVDPPDDRYPAGHFVEAVKAFILANEAFGPTRGDRRDLLFTGGLKIHTTLDRDIQRAAEAAVRGVIPDDPAMPIAALVAVEPGTGAVRALWGGHDFFSGTPKAKVDFATVGRRQAGSAFKPFALVTALGQDLRPEDRIDAPARVTIELPEGQEWRVSNYSGRSYGRITLADATIHSVNTAYARLVMELGPQQVVDTAREMGIRSPLLPLPSAVLGANSVTPLDMANAYATLAHDGVRAEPTFVTRVETVDGEVLYEHEPQLQRVLAKPVARHTVSILESVISSGTGWAAQLGERPAAGKTGTAQEWRDAWFTGFTPQLSTAVWVGFPDRPRPMAPPATPRVITGGSWPAQVWRDFMSAALEGDPPRPFPELLPFPERATTTTSSTLPPVTEAPPTTSPPTTSPPTTSPPTTSPPSTTAPPTTASSTTSSSTTSSSTTSSSTTTTTSPPSTTSSTTTTTSTPSTTAPPTTASSTTSSSTTTTTSPGPDEEG